MNNKIVLIILIILNAIVLLGQILPESAPPFARIVNILFLVASLLHFLSMLRNNKKIN